MKTKEQRKAELLDNFIQEATKSKWNTPWLVRDLFVKHHEIESEKTLQQDPYANEHFSLRILTILDRMFHGDTSDMRLSECPSVGVMLKQWGFGYKSKQEYKQVMTKFGFTDKLT